MKLPYGLNVPLAARRGLTRDEAMRELRTAMKLMVGHDGRQSIECETSANNDSDPPMREAVAEVSVDQTQS